MVAPSDRSYFERRLVEERDRARASASPEAAAAHRGLAERYQRQLAALMSGSFSPLVRS